MFIRVTAEGDTLLSCAFGVPGNISQLIMELWLSNE